MFTAILSAFLGGIILNLMPCVFPIISLKAFGLVRQGGDQGRLRREGIAFFAGTIIAMLLLGGTLLALRAAGEAVGWGFQLQSPPVVAILVLIMVGSALNLAGLFEVGVGLQRAGQQVDDREGLFGAFLTGALAVVVATPCAGPFMAGALGYAIVQTPVAGLSVFAALAAGVAAPFTILSFSPALARRLPRPGPWMATLKHALVFPMLGAAAWLVWVLSAQTGSSGLAVILACAIILGVVSWLYGLAQQRAYSGKSARSLKGGAAAGLAIIAVALALPGNGLEAQEARRDMAAAPQAEARPMPWSPARVQAAQAAGRPVFVDFSAAWCLTCQVNEKAVLSTAPFKDAVARTGTVYMIADSTNYNAAIEAAMARLGRTGLPLYILYPAKGGEPVILPQILRTAAVVSAIETAARSSS